MNLWLTLIIITVTMHGTAFYYDNKRGYLTISTTCTTFLMWLIYAIIKYNILRSYN